jgi:hypothetical protein
MKQIRFTEEQIIAVLPEHEAGAMPGMVVSDHGTESTSNAILGWTKVHGVEWC